MTETTSSNSNTTSSSTFSESNSNNNINNNTAAAGGGGWWSWGSSILNTVKETSEQIYHVYKEDLVQFQSIVSEDTKKKIEESRVILERDGAIGITSKLTSGVTSGLSKITEGLVNINTQFSSYLTEETDIQQRLKKLQQDPSNFTTSLDSDPKFLEWKSTFHSNLKKEETQQILATNQDIYNTYTQLVPSLISPQDFWERYFYRIKLINDDEEKRAALLKRAAVQTPLVPLTWDDEFEEEKQNITQQPNNKNIPSDQIQSLDITTVIAPSVTPSLPSPSVTPASASTPQAPPAPVPTLTPTPTPPLTPTSTSLPTTTTPNTLPTLTNTSNIPIPGTVHTHVHTAASSSIENNPLNALHDEPDHISKKTDNLDDNTNTSTNTNTNTSTLPTNNNNTDNTTDDWEAWN